MKKVMALCLAVILLLSLSTTVFAAGGFVSSPTNTQAPAVGSTVKTETGAKVTVEITAFADRTDLSAEAKEELAAAHDVIAKNEDLSKAVPAVADVAKAAGVAVADLAVSDLFDISVESAAATGKVTLSLKSDSLKKFVALLHFTDNKWEVVEGAKVVNGELQFTVDSFSPFAIVVAADDVVPGTGGSSSIYLFAALAAVSACAVVVLWKKNKKFAAQ